MIADIWTVIWKEVKELFLQQPKFRGGWLGMLFFIGVFGIFMPLQFGVEWLSSPATLLTWAWVPFLLVNSMVADSFAGERERHTLETLLASRLSDRAILFGKIGAAILYGWGLTLTSVSLSLVVVNVAHWQGKLMLFPLDIGLGILIFSFLIAALSAGLGVLISMSATTVRQAQQTLSALFFVFFIPMLVFPLLPVEWRASIAHILVKTDLSAVAWIIAITLLVLDTGLFGLAMARFKRARLILD